MLLELRDHRPGQRLRPIAHRVPAVGVHVLVLVRGDELTERSRIELGCQQCVGRPIPGEAPVGIVVISAEGEGFGMREEVRHE